MKLRNIALVAALFVGAANMAGAALAQTKIYVVSEDRARRESKVGKEINQTLVTNANAGVDQLGLKTLKAEIDAEAWATLNSDVSRPFEKPKTGRIAVKVINHLGDEVMKVFGVG